MAVPYSGGVRIPGEHLFEIMGLRMPHHILPSTFDVSDWLKGVLFIVTLGIAWRWLRSKTSRTVPGTSVSDDGGSSWVA